MKSLKPVAIVTGANRGLGRETSRQLANLGYQVIVTARSIKSAQDTVNQLGRSNLTAAQLDITDQVSVDSLATSVAAEYGRLDVLVNNAAIHYDTWQNVLNADLNTIKEAMDTNVYGALRMIQAFLPMLENSSQARIVNVSSGAGEMSGGMSGSTPAYSLSKLALNGLTMMLDSQLSRNILINAVCPGWVATDMGGSGGRPVQDGAKGIVWAATKVTKSGGFYRDGQPIAW